MYAPGPSAGSPAPMSGLPSAGGVRVAVVGEDLRDRRLPRARMSSSVNGNSVGTGPANFGSTWSFFSPPAGTSCLPKPASVALGLARRRSGRSCCVSSASGLKNRL